MKRFLRTFLCLITAAVLCFTVLPVVHQTVADASDEYIVWDAGADQVLEDPEKGLAPDGLSVANAYVMRKGKDEPERYFTADFSVTGQGGITKNAIFKTGITSSEPGFGWMANNTFIKKLTNLYISFDYRVTSEEALPSDAKLNLTAAVSGNANVCNFASVSAVGTSVWTNATAKVGGNFSMFWDAGYLNVYLSTASGSFSGTQKVDLKNIRLFVKEGDRINFNSGLTKASFTNIDNFSAGITMGTDSAGKRDFFALMIAYHPKSAYGSDPALHTVSATCTEGADFRFSLKRARAGETVTVYTRTEDHILIESVTGVTAGGTAVPIDSGAKNVRYSFTMPDDDVSLEIKTTRAADPSYILLWYCDPPTQQYAPYFTGVSARPYTWGLTNAGDRTAWTFNITQNQGTMTLYGKGNRSYPISGYYDTATLTMRVKLESENGNHTLRLASNNNEPVDYALEVNSEWQDISVPLRDVTGNDSISFLQFDLSDLSVGDQLSLADVCIWNREVQSSEKGFESVTDMSDFQKNDSNILLGVIGDTEAEINPWNELRNTIPEPIAWDRAWYYQFQNAASWVLNPQPDYLGNEYNITFYPEDRSVHDAAAYLDTGYMEFFCKSETDGIVFPVAVNGRMASGRVYVTTYVRYEKAKARPDGYMCVRIPFRYIYDMGLDLDAITYVSVKGSMIIPDTIVLSSFRFYSQYADVPEPEPIVEPQPEPERDLPIELDRSVLNARLDKENMVLYVPQNTKIWEVLAAVTLDTDESTVTFFDTDVVSDTEKTVDESMKMILYRRGYYVNRFDIQIPVTGTVLRRTDGTTVTEHSGETPVSPKTADRMTVPLCAGLLGMIAVCCLSMNRMKKYY